ncbi:MAG: glycosyltransferase family 39 protein [Anaerolineae bacterium]
MGIYGSDTVNHRHRIKQPSVELAQSRYAHETLVVVGLTALALLLRVIALGALPPGLYHDEAYNGLDALRILQGEFPLFFEANNGREPLFIYLCAAAVGVLGRTPAALRLVSALVGTLTVPATYWMGRELYGRRVGAFAAILVATSVWTLNLSRIGLRAVTLPLLLAVCVTLAWQGLMRRRPMRMVWAGIVYGLTFYSYLAARFSLLWLALFAVYVLLVRRELLWPKGWLLFAAAAALTAAPLALYMLSHWQSTMERATQVSILNPAIHGGDPWRALARNAWRSVGGLFWRGDFIPRHNVPLRPVFDPLTALACLGGAGLMLRNWRCPAGALILLWVAVMLLPTTLAEGAPHMLRAAGVLPGLYLLPALGLDGLVRWAAARGWARSGGLAVAAVLVFGATGGLSAYVRHARSEAAFFNFETGAAELAADVNAFLGSGWAGDSLRAAESAPRTDRRAYMASQLWHDWSSVRYLCPVRPNLMTLASDGTGIPPEPGEDVLLALWPFEDNSAALSLLPRDRLVRVEEGALERGDLETESRLLYVTWRTESQGGVPRNVQATWQGGIHLMGYRVQSLSQNQLRVQLYWQAPESEGTEPPVAYTAFVHVLQDGQRIGQHDGPPAAGYYGTDRWRSGDLVEDVHVIDLQSPAAEGCQIVVGLYHWETMERLRLIDAEDNLAGDTLTLPCNQGEAP